MLQEYQEDVLKLVELFEQLCVHLSVRSSMGGDTMLGAVLLQIGNEVSVIRERWSGEEDE